MMNEDKTNHDEQKQDNFLKPDSETMHTTDPQENMKGPVSSTVHKTGEAFKTDETKREADQKKEERM